MSAPEPYFGSECAFPACDCVGPDDGPACADFETSNETQRLLRILEGRPCPAHELEEPCAPCLARIDGHPAATGRAGFELDDRGSRA